MAAQKSCGRQKKVAAAKRSSKGRPHTLVSRFKMAQISSPESPTKLAIDDEYDIMQYYVVDGVRLPPFCRGKMQDVASFPVRKDDVWIVSYPRAGRWLGVVRNSHFALPICPAGGCFLTADRKWKGRSWRGGVKFREMHVVYC